MAIAPAHRKRLGAVVLRDKKVRNATHDRQEFCICKVMASIMIRRFAWLTAKGGHLD